MLDKFIKLLQVERPLTTLIFNFSNYVFLVVFLTNLLIVINKQIFTRHGSVNVYKMKLLVISKNKVKVIAPKKLVKAKISIGMKT